MPWNKIVTVRVDFPALDALVAYLRDHDEQQGQIDALAATVTDLTARLQKSTAGLESSVDHEKDSPKEN